MTIVETTPEDIILGPTLTALLRARATVSVIDEQTLPRVVIYFRRRDGESIEADRD